ncbi:protein kinase C-like 1 [Hemibagrus wyckioides]|uniref:protein kinase C-like 1 n=1 Tax=Hemibagrus wyckioides TaxID=337641 RepID=UPI00266B84A4|nr:protein kinase C-like 1 [Hemibagrus wyckioides]
MDVGKYFPLLGRWTGRGLACAAGMLALTTAGYCAYRWLKRSSDLQAAEDQAAHGSSVDVVEEAETTEVTDPSVLLLCTEHDPQMSADALVSEINIQLQRTSLDPEKSAVILLLTEMMATMDEEMQSNPVVHMPHHERESSLLQGDDTYLPDGENICFPGPLMRSKIQMDDVLRFIKRKSEECLQKVEEPDQKEAYFFWQMMELRCSKNGKAPLADIATVLFKSYRLLKKRGEVNNQDSWCLQLAELLCSADPDDEILDALTQMGEDLDSRGLWYAAQLCFIAAMEELQILQSPSFELIGCNSLPISQSAMREAIQRSEVYEYVCSLTTGLPQPNFQIFKCYHASKLAEFGLFHQALEYCETIATAIARFPLLITKTTMEMTIALSEKLQQGKGEEPEWLLNLRQLYADEEFKLRNSECGLMTSEMFTLQRPRREGHITPWEVFESLYTPGELLGEGGFGSVCAGVRKADGKQVAIKYVGMEMNEAFITIPGETHSLPLEVALMQMVSKPCHHENVLQLIEWFEMSDCYILILERPSPCTDLLKFLKGHKGRLSEPLAQRIMRQVVQAAHHCSDCGVLHRDIKPENILINTDTLQLKLIDFGCGDLLQDIPYRYYAGTTAYSPPEWLCEGEYLGVPATVWSLGVLLFEMMCGDLPFQCEDDIIARDLHFAHDLSEGCRDLILCCLALYPHSRPTFEEILSHRWFEEPQKNV